MPSISYDVIHATGRCKSLGSVELPDRRSSAHRKAGRLEELMVANGNGSLAKSFTGPCQIVLAESAHFCGLFLTPAPSRKDCAWEGGAAGRRLRRAERARKACEDGSELSDALSAP